MPRRAVLCVLVVLVVAGSVAGCSSDDDLQGECAARILVGGEVFRPVNGMNVPRRGTARAEGAWVGCDGSEQPSMGTVDVYEVEGADPADVLLAAEEGGDYVYMRESIPWAERPQLVVDRARYVPCTGPATLTGRWLWIDPEEAADQVDLAAELPPYTAALQAREGTGIGLDRWAEVMVPVEITAATRPAPDETLLRQVLEDDVPVTVRLACRGTDFEAVRIAPAR
ncbi:hypothetical protein ACFP8W_19840 [Nocardioides hankookensis]